MTKILQGRKTLSLEMIAVQDDLFPKKLDELHEMLRIKVRDGTYKTGADLNDSDEIKGINALFWDRMRMKIFVTWEKHATYVVPFWINGKSVFNRFSKPSEVVDVDTAKYVRQLQNGDTGTIDETNVKLGGMFTKFECYVFLDYLYSFGSNGLNLSAREATAVLLHEVGHVFYLLAYSDRVSRTNQVLSSILDEVRNHGPRADRHFIYRELKHINANITESEVDELINGKSIVTGYRWYLRVLDSLGGISSIQLNDKYSDTSFEALSDNFVSRFGYGRDLVTVLDKYYSDHGVEEKSIIVTFGTIMNDILFLHSLISSIIVATVGVGTILVPALWIYPFLLYGIYLQLMKLYKSGAAYKDYTYDDVKDRYKRIRQDMVQQLKNSAMNLDLKRRIIVSIEQIDQVIEKTRKFDRPLAMLSNFLFTDNRSTHKNVLEQQLMEEMANNDLFLKSAQLSSLS